MPLVSLVRSSPIIRSKRVRQVEKAFSLKPSPLTSLGFDADLPYEDRAWHIGLVVGPSGSGKSTLAHALWPDHFQAPEWDADRSVIDGLTSRPIKDVVRMLTSVGFGSPPAWLRPFHVLSNGEQFRVNVARALLEVASPDDIAVIDEYSSVIDRTVAQIGSAAIHRAVHRHGAHLVAVTCHEDILEWLQPDWVYRTDTQQFSWREVGPRPPIDLQMVNVPAVETWRYFSHHHYLTNVVHRASSACVAFWRGRPVGYISGMHFMHPTASGWRSHRLVCLPDYQGVGIGAAIADAHNAAMAATGLPVYLAVAHPSSVAYCSASPNYVMTRQPSLKAKSGGDYMPAANWHKKAESMTRMTASFKWVGPPMNDADARILLHDRLHSKLGGRLRQDLMPV